MHEMCTDQYMYIVEVVKLASNILHVYEIAARESSV